MQLGTLTATQRLRCFKGCNAVTIVSGVRALGEQFSFHQEFIGAGKQVFQQESNSTQPDSHKFSLIK